jgi:acetoin utilization protein AcuB
MPHTIGSAQSVAVAKRMMKENGIRHLPVQERGTLIGIISERDIFFADRLQPEDPDALAAADICTLDPDVFSPDTPLKLVIQTMAEQGIGCALIVDNDTLVGIFTTVDACRLLAEYV